MNAAQAKAVRDAALQDADEYGQIDPTLLPDGAGGTSPQRVGSGVKEFQGNANGTAYAVDTNN